MPIPLIPIVVGVALKAALKQAVKQTVKRKPKAFRSANQRSAEEQTAYLDSINLAKQTRFAKNAARRTKQKLVESKKLLDTNK